MKTLKALLVTLSAVLLTGCYTQLQYSQTMHRVTEDRGRDYDQNEYYEDNYDDDYIPVYYKDYEYAEFWAECGCNPYIENNFYGGYDHWPHYYHPTHRPFFFSYYDWNPFWGFHNRYFGATFAFSFHWGSPYYPSFFYDPFYSPFYYPFYGYRPVAFNYFYFYNPGGFYYGDNDVIRDNRRYGPRSIGTSRVIDRSERSRARSRGAINRTHSVRSRSSVRTRSVGNTRTRGTVNRSAGSSVRSRGHSVGRSRGRNDHSSRIRSRGNVQRIESRSERSVDHNPGRSIQRDRSQRSSNIIRYRSIDSDDYSIKQVDPRSEIRSRLRDQMVPKIDFDRRERSRPSFFQRMRSFFDSNSSSIFNRSSRSNGRSIRIRNSSSYDRPTIQRSRSRNRSSVSRSRSSSSSSRSRGTSSRSRSSNSRSRGN